MNIKYIYFLACCTLLNCSQDDTNDDNHEQDRCEIPQPKTTESKTQKFDNYKKELYHKLANDLFLPDATFHFNKNEKDIINTFTSKILLSIENLKDDENLQSDEIQKFNYDTIINHCESLLKTTSRYFLLSELISFAQYINLDNELLENFKNAFLIEQRLKELKEELDYCFTLMLDKLLTFSLSNDKQKINCLFNNNIIKQFELGDFGLETQNDTIKKNSDIITDCNIYKKLAPFFDNKNPTNVQEKDREKLMEFIKKEDGKIMESDQELSEANEQKVEAIEDILTRIFL